MSLLIYYPINWIEEYFFSYNLQVVSLISYSFSCMHGKKGVGKKDVVPPETRGRRQRRPTERAAPLCFWRGARQWRGSVRPPAAMDNGLERAPPL
jgi:hypothetical protein